MPNRLRPSGLGTWRDRRPASADLAFTMSCHLTSLGGAPDEWLAIAGVLGHLPDLDRQDPVSEREEH